MAGNDEVDRELLDRVTREIRALEASGATLMLTIPPSAVLGLVGLVQLGLRHPGVSRSGNTSTIGRAVIAFAYAFFAGSPMSFEVIQRSDDPAEDVDWSRP